MVAWPSNIPSWALAGTLSEQIERNVAEFQPEVGKPIRRRRSSIATVLMTYETMMTPAQYALAETFYKDTLKDGTLTFTMTHPRTKATETFEFTSSLAYNEHTLGALRVSINLRKLP